MNKTMKEKLQNIPLLNIIISYLDCRYTKSGLVTAWNHLIVKIVTNTIWMHLTLNSSNLGVYLRRNLHRDQVLTSCIKMLM